MLASASSDSTVRLWNVGTGALRDTLEELVDFSMINDKAIRFSVGAVNVLSGNFIYFDNAREEIAPERALGDERRQAAIGRRDEVSTGIRKMLEKDK